MDYPSRNLDGYSVSAIEGILMELWTRSPKLKAEIL
jgi:hypothetical protein